VLLLGLKALLLGQRLLFLPFATHRKRADTETIEEKQKRNTKNTNKLDKTPLGALAKKRLRLTNTLDEQA
jgi:hypothetical protein